MRTFAKIIFAPVFWLIQACSPLGNPVDPKKSDNHYFNKKGNDIHFSRMGNWFELSNIPMNADVESFEVFNKIFSKDKNQLYFSANAVAKGTVDLASFYTKNDFYTSYIGFDNNHAYTFEHTNEQSKKVKASIIDGADPKTYTCIDHYWAKDDKHHFYRNKMTTADYDTFEVLNDNFSIDKNSIFYQDSKGVKPIDADTASFEMLNSKMIAKDKSNVYWSFYKENDLGASKVLVTIPIKTEETVAYFDDHYIRIGNNIYFLGKQIEDIDLSSFELLDIGYVKDKNHVFYDGQILKDADVGTFGPIKNGYGDKNGPFSQGKRIVK